MKLLITRLTMSLNRIIASIVLIVTLLFVTDKAFAFCSAPIAPEPPSTYTKPIKPVTPFCVNEFSNTHTCDDWEITSYNNEISNYRSEVQYYVQKLKNYISEAEYFVTETVDYAKCEIRNLN